MNRRTRLLAGFAVLFVAAGLLLGPTALRLARRVANKVLPPDPAISGPYENAHQPDEPAPQPEPPLPAGSTVVYQNGIRLATGKPDYKQDIKQVVRTGDTQRLTNYPAGYALTLPADMQLDFRYSPAYVRASRTNLDIKISRERSPYEDVANEYIEPYPNRHLIKPEWRENNNIKLLEDTWVDIGKYRTRILSFARTPAPGSPETQNQYLIAYVLTGGREFYTFSFRTDSLEQHRTSIQQVLESFTRIEAKGLPKYNLDFHPVPGKWNKETQEYYSKLVGSNEFQWGFYYPPKYAEDATYGTDPESLARVESVQQALDYKFPILLIYRLVWHPFPREAMQQAYERGQTMELTLQIAAPQNSDDPVRNANFDLLDGKYDQQLRQFAREAKAFGHPFLFRLNNEMNTDWSQYSGVLMMNDPDIYIKVWHYIFRIFEEEGVDNAIWIFNPNDKTFPPMNWNLDTAYYPGNGYVHLLGITGYNSGSFKKDTGEVWRGFSEIYSELASNYRPVYGRFPWIITEFASSSFGGDKQAWIEEMFRELPKYPEIKAAVWWSYADYHMVDGELTATRRYWLDEKPEYLEAFKQGLQQQKK